jgi:hypothetical protein
MLSDDLFGVSRGCVAAVINYNVSWADRLRVSHVVFGDAPDYLPALPFGGFEWSDSSSGATIIHLPLWAIALGLGAPAAWLWARHRRLRATDCPACGYDLSATPRNSKCPECGQEAKSSAESSAA